MPTRIRRLVASLADDFHIISEHSWPVAGRPVVWEVEGPDGQRWFAKRHAGPKGHRREVTAYQRGWVAALGTNRAPALVAADGEALAIVITAVPGRPVRGLRLAADQEREIYRQAGHLLARLHSAPLDEPVPVADGAKWDEAVEKMLGDAALYLPAHDITMLRVIAEKSPPALSSVVSHADFMPRNWLWDEVERRLRIIDFERACVEPPACRDFSRLGYRILRARADLEGAFYGGYGRTPTADERRACFVYAAVDAVSLLRWALEHGDIESVEEARTMMEHLRAEYTHRFRKDTTG